MLQKKQKNYMVQATALQNICSKIVLQKAALLDAMYYKQTKVAVIDKGDYEIQNLFNA